MSGIVGIVNLDGAPVDRLLLQQMTDFLAFRGPDAQAVWADGSVGFGHTMLRTTWESQDEQQPCTLDGRVWITADARIDGQEELVAALKAKGCQVRRGATDAELILHAYQAWGEACVEHLIGDFAFAIWDGRHRRLFAARDQFGIKPFYYAEVPSGLILSNTLRCLRLHPDVSDELNDQAIGDFLLFSFNQDPSTTAFADIRQLSPAHRLSWSADGLRLSRYWELPVGDIVRYKRRGDYVERFRELLRESVADRLRTDKVGVFMSGGLDSPALAATAQAILSERARPFDLHAYTVVYDRLIPDQERHYAGLVAERLGIPTHFIVADDYRLFERRDDAASQHPEPFDEPLDALSVDFHQKVSSRCRVALSGYDGDAALKWGVRAHFANLIQSRRPGELLADVACYVRTRRQFPFPGIRAWANRYLVRSRSQESNLPEWVNPAFAERLDLASRWEKYVEESAPAIGPPARAKAYHTYSQVPLWVSVLGGYDAGITTLPLEVRHPLMDLRLLGFLLSLPPVPWCVKKWIFREAFREALPGSVCRRPKSPLAGDPIDQLLRQPDAHEIDRLDLASELAHYVTLKAIPRVGGVKDRSSPWWQDLRPHCLNHWLCSPSRSRPTRLASDFPLRPISTGC